MKTYQHDYYSTLLCFDSMLSYNTSVQNNIILTTAKQNQKFPFHFFFRFAVEGWGEETRKKCKEIFWFLHTRVRERVRGVLYRFPTQSERTERFRATTRSARAISRQNPADFVRNTFELRPIHTAQSSFYRAIHLLAQKIRLKKSNFRPKCLGFEPDPKARSIERPV